MQQLVRARYQIRIKPNKNQYSKILQFAGCSRFVYNHLLEVSKNRYTDGLKCLNIKEMEAEIKKLKLEYEWLKDCDSAVLQQSRIDFQKAVGNFFKGLNGTYSQRYSYPKFKSRCDSIRYRTPCNNGNVNAINRKLKLPKIGLVPIIARCLPEYERLTSVTIVVEPSGKVCSSCGAYHKDIVNSLAVRNWTCPDCGAVHDRDVNAAKNILMIGLNDLVNE